MAYLDDILNTAKPSPSQPSRHAIPEVSDEAVLEHKPTLSPGWTSTDTAGVKTKTVSHPVVAARALYHSSLPAGYIVAMGNMVCMRNTQHCTDVQCTTAQEYRVRV